MKIDAHHHLWRYLPEDFPWMDDSLHELRQDFLFPALQPAMEAAGVEAAIVVQARSTLPETEWLLQQAALTPAICGVVGWIPLADCTVPELLDTLADAPKLVAFRELTEFKDAGYLTRPDVQRGLKALTERQYPYELLVRCSRQRQEALHCVDLHPHASFILDHAGKPSPSGDDLATWRRWLRSLARRDNVVCKISGLATQLALGRNWTLEDLRPYLDACVDAFGPERLLAGSDWPVCLVATGYGQWWDALSHYFHSFSRQEQLAVFRTNSLRIYRCTLADATTSEAASPAG